MLVTESLATKLLMTLMLATFFIMSVIFSVLNQSPPSHSCHQYISPPTSIAQIDEEKLSFLSLNCHF